MGTINTYLEERNTACALQHYNEDTDDDDDELDFC